MKPGTSVLSSTYFITVLTSRLAGVYVVPRYISWFCRIFSSLLRSSIPCNAVLTSLKVSVTNRARSPLYSAVQDFLTWNDVSIHSASTEQRQETKIHAALRSDLIRSCMTASYISEESRSICGIEIREKKGVSVRPADTTSDVETDGRVNK